GSGAEAIEAVRSDNAIAVVVMDIKMAGMSGIEAAREIRRIAPHTRVIFHTAYPGEYDEDEIDSTEQPFGYVQKSSPSSRLTREIRNAMEAYILSCDSNRLIALAESAFGLVGRSPAMQEIYRLIHKVAASDTSVMILGETGVGKGLVARAIHEFSPRRQNLFKKFNCNHTPQDLVESELFGHVKGAFSGAHADRIGLFEFASGGTVFLDEIGDLSMASQGKILDVIETGEFEPIGWTGQSRHTDVRIVCATNRDMSKLLREGDFREDAYYRLKGAEITVPPLRERKEDIPLLVEWFQRQYADSEDGSLKHFDSSATDVLMHQDWPGNVRQLQNTVRSLMVLADSPVIVASDVERFFGSDQSFDATSANGDSLAERIRHYRRTCIVQALHETDGNVNAAARMLQEDPSNLRRWIKTLDITVPHEQ
ncbi:response regulator, partial [candidate division GN15 bacterium]|nr:response regulator [candidate division GN15 bacterium]